MIEVRKLAAIDLLFLGSKVILAEFGLGVIGPPALGLLTLVRSHSPWQTVFGVYLLSLGVNYVPLLLYSIAMVRRGSAADEMAGELADRDRAFRKYRRLSLLLLVPLVMPILAILQERQRTH